MGSSNHRGTAKRYWLKRSISPCPGFSGLTASTQKNWWKTGARLICQHFVHTRLAMQLDWDTTFSLLPYKAQTFLEPTLHPKSLMN